MNTNTFVIRSSLVQKTVALIVSSILCLAPVSVSAQTGGTIEAGMTVPVRMVEDIRVSRSDGRIFGGQIDRDVRNRRGAVALPRGTAVELMVREIGNDEYILDLESILVNGQHLTVSGENSPVFEADERREGLGANSRTGRYVGTGALVGAIIGAITGGGKGAAIGGGVGAAAGAGTQVLTRGRNVVVPAESLVTFQLQQPLRVGRADNGFSRNGSHYHPGYGTHNENTPAYAAGLRAGRADRQRNLVFFARSDTWRGIDAQEYREGYTRGYGENPRRLARNNSSIQIGADRYIRWSGPVDSRVYVQTDNRPRQLFSGHSSGVEPAPWINYGHRYVFTLVDRNGREIARDENDLRRGPRTSN
jgi:hypothetical protein